MSDISREACEWFVGFCQTINMATPSQVISIGQDAGEMILALRAALDAAEADKAAAVELAQVKAAGGALARATASLRHAVLGPDGYQAAIQMATGFEYPWPALGFAAEATETALAAWASAKEASHE